MTPKRPWSRPWGSRADDPGATPGPSGGSHFPQGWHRESDQIRKDESTFPVELSVSLTEIDGKSNLLCFARNITERKIAELREQSLRKLAHDLNDSTDMRTVGQLAAKAETTKIKQRDNRRDKGFNPDLILRLYIWFSLVQKSVECSQPIHR